MAVTTHAPGRLIAVDASRSRDVAAEAEAILRRLRARGVPCGISRWDASGLFGDLLMADPDELIVAPRTLTLLYAADLMFRLKWEIRPALAAGQVVIAAPYVETAVAFGRAAGIPAGWLANLFRFAPRATEHYFVHRAAKPGKNGVEGFVRFGCERMRGKPGGRTPRQILSGTAAELRRMAGRGSKR